MPGSVVERWHRLPASGKAKLVATILGVALCLVASVSYMVNSDGLSVVDPEHPGYSYLAVFLLVAFDGVIPIFPAETTLNAASTLAAQGKLDLGPIILMGALGAIVGDSTLFWLARKNAHRFERQVEPAKAIDRVRQALDMMDSSAPRSSSSRAATCQCALRGERDGGDPDLGAGMRVNTETASQQLGHSSPAITREFYISKPTIAADVAHVLEELARPEAD